MRPLTRVVVMLLASFVFVPVTTARLAAQDAEAVEASLSLDRAARRLIQQGLRSEGFDPGVPDGMFGPRTRGAIRAWQQSLGTSSTGYLSGAEAALLRRAAAAPPEAVSAIPPNALSSADPPAAATAAEPPADQSSAATEAAPRVGTETRVPAMGRAQLPPEILVDRHLVRMERLLAAGEPGAALEAMDEILALRDEHGLVLGDDFGFRYAQAAFAAGLMATAIASLNEYLVAAGRAGEFYREALELLDSAEVRLQREEAERTRLIRWRPSEVFRDCDVCPEMVVMPGGRLALGRYEVTVEEYRAFASRTGGGAGGGCVESDSWSNPGFPQTDRHPVTCVSWDDAQAYVSWLSRTAGATYRLPTEAEWDRAAAGSRPGCYSQRTGNPGTCPVGSYRANDIGLFDMVGNLWEWTEDCWEGDCSRRVERGSSWFNPAESQQPGARYHYVADRRNSSIGFRVTRTLD